MLALPEWTNLISRCMGYSTARPHSPTMGQPLRSPNRSSSHDPSRSTHSPFADQSLTTAPSKLMRNRSSATRVARSSVFPNCSSQELACESPCSLAIPYRSTSNSSDRSQWIVPPNYCWLHQAWSLARSPRHSTQRAMTRAMSAASEATRAFPTAGASPYS